ncbi:MAG: sigma factor [Saprospiraceae bacterium]
MAFFTDFEFKQFYLDTFPVVRTYILAKCGDLKLAEDLAQEGFIRLWNHQQKVETLNAKSFLFTVINNLFSIMSDTTKWLQITLTHLK